MFEGLRDAIYDTKDDVQKIAERIAANLTGEIPGIGTFGIPLNPKQANYIRVKYWPQSAWQVIRNGAKVKDVNSSVLSLFFEDEFGDPVSAGVGEEVRGDLTAYWVDMLMEGEVPVHYSGLGLKRREDFRKTMEDKYPWLRLCEGHWKVRQLWVNHYRKSRIVAIIDNDPSLKIKFAALGRKSLDPIEISSDAEDARPVQKKKAVVVVSSDTEDSSPAPRNATNKAPVRPSNPVTGSKPIEPSDSSTGSKPTEPSDSSTGSKRGRQDTDDPLPASPKKHKGKETATSGFHHPKPQAKKAKQKATGKIGKVSCGSSCSSAPC
jgi:hypothetical protein